MKPLLLCLFVLSALALNAQNCESYYFLQNNKTVEMTIYGKKGEVSGKQVYKVSDVKTSAGITTASINSEMFDKKNKSIATSSSAIKCKGGMLMVDMKMMMGPQQQQTTTKASIEEGFLEYPNKIAIGDQLQDAVFNMDLETSGIPQKIKLTMTERKVVAKESVTTTAGTWECYKISYKGKIVINTAGINMPMNTDGSEWYAPGFGVVKTETKNGGTAITSVK
ncbi:MAG: hypothetical protein H7Y27_12385 [Gemmatimonadaceae bacterium]|nr:hypothetical protein [Chitinophagaceae bacterium]